MLLSGTGLITLLSHGPLARTWRIKNSFKRKHSLQLSDVGNWARSCSVSSCKRAGTCCFFVSSGFSGFTKLMHGKRQGFSGTSHSFIKISKFLNSNGFDTLCFDLHGRGYSSIAQDAEHSVSLFVGQVHFFGNGCASRCFSLHTLLSVQRATAYCLFSYPSCWIHLAFFAPFILWVGPWVGLLSPVKFQMFISPPLNLTLIFFLPP